MLRDWGHAEELYTAAGVDRQQEQVGRVPRCLRGGVGVGGGRD